MCGSISEEGSASGGQGPSEMVPRGDGFGRHHEGPGEPQQGGEGGWSPLSLPLSPQSMESQVEEWYREVGELQAQTAALPLEPASKELVGERQNAVGERLVRLLEPLQERRRLLLASKELHQVAHDLDDELVRTGAGTGRDRGNREVRVARMGRVRRPQGSRRASGGVEVGSGGEAVGPWRVQGRS